MGRRTHFRKKSGLGALNIGLLLAIVFLTAFIAIPVSALSPKWILIADLLLPVLATISLVAGTYTYFKRK